MKDQAADLIDCWVVDDLICDMKRCSWVLLPGLVRHLHCSLHSPAVPISLCQLDLDVLQRAAYTQTITVGQPGLDQRTGSSAIPI